MTAREWGVLLIGGGGAVGKTSVAQPIAARFGASTVSADDIRLVLQRAIPASANPDLHYFLAADPIALDIDDAVQRLMHIGRVVSDALEIVIRHHVATGHRVVIEGDSIQPDLAVRETYADLAAPGSVRAVFVEEPDVDLVEAGLAGRGRGADTSQTRRRWAEIHHAHGRELAAEARHLGLPVVPARPHPTLSGRVVRAGRL